MKLNRNRICFCFIFLISAASVGAQSEIKKESPFTYELSYLGDVLTNMYGGIQTGTVYLGMANISIGFYTEKAGLWRGGEFFVNGANTHGDEPTSMLIGDFQGVSNIEAGELTYLHELWFKQAFKNLRFIIGLQDLNAEFASNDFGEMFINSSFGIHSTIADNVPSPIFPLTRLGATVEWNVTEKIEFKIAVFDGLLSDYQNNDYNTNWDLNTEEGLLYVGEIVFSTAFFNDKPGSCKLGFYNHNHQVQKETGENFITENNMGVYLLVDQLVYKNSNGEGGIGIFTQLGLSKSEINNHYAYLGFGFNYCGISNNRCSDEIGLALAHTWFKTGLTGNETAIELSYKAVLGEHIFVQPDIQYIINPSGTDEALNNAFVGIFRFGINF